MYPLDPWRAAKLLLTQLEDEAPAHASRRITELTNAGDQAGANAWSDILAAISQLRMDKRREGDAIH